VPESFRLVRQRETRGLKNEVFTRSFDVLCAGIGLFLLSPLFGLIAAAIKIDDGGPVFYEQVRVGRMFRPFRVLKFRSMVMGADQKGLLTAPTDSRLTRMGRILREYKLDELPQLLNVLHGDMQLVGARPEVGRYVEMFRPQYALILQERPGLTDPATVAYSREDRVFSSSKIEQQYVSEILPEKLRLSLEYQRRRGFFSDLGILLKTIASLAA
jgi:lipopolysaccharide/colanic/teichoic acid biosynthesis glycosyltransferase